MVFASLQWYLSVADTIRAIYQEELFREPEPEGLFNWIFHAREEARDAAWMRDYIRQSPEWHHLHDPSPLPPVPTREQVCGVKTSFQGLTVQTAQFGALPWFGAALAWLGSADRAAVYAAQHTAGDTHCLIHLPSGPPLYDEPGQPYSADRFGLLDWTAGGTKLDPQFKALVLEVIQNGFIPIIFLGGDAGEAGYVIATKQLPLVVAELGDIMGRVLVVPGYDGVFYGWTPEHIGAFGRQFRTLCPTGHLGLEHSTGHIPVGGGPADWAAGGLMQAYDVVLSEFDPQLSLDSTWQVAARLLGPAYHRPSDQPAGDDPAPPFYLAAGTPRGPYFTCAFEFQTYWWVRGLVTAAQIAANRAYLRNLGFTYLG